MSRNGQTDVERIVRRRFNNRWQAAETKLVSDYLYHLTVQPGSGEFAMNSLLVPMFSSSIGERRHGVYARQPLMPRVRDFPSGVPIRVQFGDHDWLMPSDNGAESLINAAQRAGKNAKLEIIKDAGHHLYLDNINSFNKSVNSLHSS